VLITGIDGMRTEWTALPPLVLLGLAWALVISSFTGWIVWGWLNRLLGVGRTAPLMYCCLPLQASPAGG
jgi:hypothetical protein